MRNNIIKHARSIKGVLQGSSWGLDPETQIVINELSELISASSHDNKKRRVSMQIFFSSRSIDTMLVWVCNWERNRIGQPALLARDCTLGGTLQRTTAPNSINGYSFNTGLVTSLRADVKDKRNLYLHKAGEFPTNTEVEQFLKITLQAIQEIARWR